MINPLIKRVYHLCIALFNFKILDIDMNNIKENTSGIRIYFLNIINTLAAARILSCGIFYLQLAISRNIKII